MRMGPTLLLLALLGALAPPAGRASSPAAGAVASAQAAAECRFWLGHRGAMVLRQLALDASGRLAEPTAEGFRTLWLVRQGTAEPLRLECLSHRPQFRPPLP
jgi:hypothetical protein